MSEPFIYVSTQPYGDNWTQSPVGDANWTSSTTNQTRGGLDRQTTQAIIFPLIVFILPTLACFGIAGNVMSVCVLFRQGLDKSYNVILVAMACSDTSFLLSNFCHVLVGQAGTYFLGQPDSFYYVFFQVLQVMDYAGAGVSFTMPLFITIERILVLFFPLKVKIIISPKRTFVAVVLVYISLFAITSYLIITATYTPYPLSPPSAKMSGNSSIATFDIINLSQIRNILDDTVSVKIATKIFFGPLPVCLVLFGCVVLGIKLKIVSRKRKEMTKGYNQDTSANRVTLALLVVCAVYAACSLAVFILLSDFIKDLYDDGSESARMVGIVLGEVANAFVLLNCSVNFIIYVVMNKRFRKTFREMFFPRYMARQIDIGLRASTDSTS